MFTESEVKQLVDAGIIEQSQGNAVLQFHGTPSAGAGHVEKHALNLQNTLYYVGGILILVALGYFTGSNWETLGDVGRIAITLILGCLFGYLGIVLRRTAYSLAGDLLLLATAAVIPLFLYAIERASGLWPVFSYNYYTYTDTTSASYLNQLNLAWAILDVFSLAGAAALFFKFRAAILSLPVVVFIWLLVTALVGLLTHTDSINGDIYKQVLGVVVGAGIIYGGWLAVNRWRLSVGIWPQLFGLILTFGSLLDIRFNYYGTPLLGQLTILIYAAVTLYLAAPLRSRTFLVFGGLGLVWFVQDLGWTYFAESLGFSAMLVLSGLATIGLGILVQRYAKRLSGSTEA